MAKKYRRMRFIAIMLVAVTAVVLYEAAYINARYVSTMAENADLRRSAELVERQNMEYRQYINETNLNGYEPND